MYICAGVTALMERVLAVDMMAFVDVLTVAGSLSSCKVPWKTHLCDMVLDECVITRGGHKSFRYSVGWQSDASFPSQESVFCLANQLFRFMSTDVLYIIVDDNAV